MTPPLNSTKAPRPPHRRLRVFAFDPSLSRRLDLADINVVTVQVPWEDELLEGPVDDYLEVVDVDPASGVCYAPADLHQPRLLAQDGLPPTETDPQFHQQMVYAVARTTIRHFEQALGRCALWSSRRYKTEEGEFKREFVRQLRIYPHALREPNAYYSSLKKALLFGYFPASRTDPGENLPGGLVFACLSHDIIAHETTHALLDGLHPRFIEPSNIEVWALHEAFADIVALFQHFSYPEVLRHQIARTGGDLERQNLLAQLAQQFGQAIGRYGALRDALGKVDQETKEWKPKEPDPQEIKRTTEPHRRGAILVAAVFDAFLTIYKWRAAGLLRIATGGTGVLPPGELHPELVERLAREAAKTARHVLHICIRALDYCPPVDPNFGDYLRALITADADLIPDDRLNYRVAFIEAFRRRGIYPLDVRTLSEESLLWEAPGPEDQKAFRPALRGPAKLRHKALRKLARDWGLKSDRKMIFRLCRWSQARLHGQFTDPPQPGAARVVGLTLEEDAPATIYRKGGLPALEVHSVRPARRVGPDGNTMTDLVVEMTQRRRGYLDPDVQEEADAGKDKGPPDFIFRGGCTLLIDLETGEVRYCVGKGIESKRRLEAQRMFLAEHLDTSLRASYFADPRRIYFKNVVDGMGEDGAFSIEPFALLHRSYDPKEVL